MLIPKVVWYSFHAREVLFSMYPFGVGSTGNQQEDHQFVGSPVRGVPGLGSYFDTQGSRAWPRHSTAMLPRRLGLRRISC